MTIKRQSCCQRCTQCQRWNLFTYLEKSVSGSSLFIACRRRWNRSRALTRIVLSPVPLCHTHRQTYKHTDRQTYTNTHTHRRRWNRSRARTRIVLSPVPLCDTHTDRQTYRHTNIQTTVKPIKSSDQDCVVPCTSLCHIHRQMYRHTDRQTDRQTDIHTDDGETDWELEPGLYCPLYLSMLHRHTHRPTCLTVTRLRSNYTAVTENCRDEQRWWL